MIVSLLYLMFSTVGLDLSSTLIGSLRYCTRIMISSVLWNYQNMYCFIFSVDFLFWSLTSIWLSMVPKTSPKPSNFPLKFQIDDVYAGRLKRPPHPLHPWWPLLPPRPTLTCPRPQLLVLDYLVVSWPMVVVVSPYQSLLTMYDGSIYVYGVVTFSFGTMLNPHHYSRSTWYITPHVCR